MAFPTRAYRPTSNRLSGLVLVALLTWISANAQPAQKSPLQIYQAGNFSEAIEVLKRLTKAEESNAEAWFYLGMSYVKLGKEKDAQKSVERSVKLSPNSDNFRAGLAYVYLLRNDQKAGNEAYAALAINNQNVEANYVTGVLALRGASYVSAYEKANLVIGINPRFAAAYLLKSEALTGSFGAQTGTVIKDPRHRYALLREAADALGKYLELAPANPETESYTTYLASLKFFSAYYERPENQQALLDGTATSTTKTPLKILSKPKAEYTGKARLNGVEGTITILASFERTGRVGNVIVLKGLDAGLNQNAIRAARAMKFQPATEGGVAISVTKTIQYVFTIY